MRISGPSAAATGLANFRARAASNAETTTQTVAKADPRVQQQSESVSVSLSSIDKVRAATPTGGTPAILATRPDTSINANSDAPRATLSPLEQNTDQSAPRQLGGDSNGGNSISPLGNSNRPLENRQTEEQARVATQQAITAQAENSSNSTNSAIAAYQRIFSL